MTAVQPTPPPTYSSAFQVAGPVEATERIGTLDVLRGIALFGMFLVHFIERGGGEATTSFGRALVTVNTWFFVDRFMTMFAILFGAGFAVQLSRAEARPDGLGARYIRRLLALAVFGVIAEDLFGFNILLIYALWGLPLLLTRNWSNRTVFIALIVCVLEFPLAWSGRAAYDMATGGAEKYRQDTALCFPPLVILPSFAATKMCTDARQRNMAGRRAARGAKPIGYLATVRARFARTWTKYAHPTMWTYLPNVSFYLFLVGVLFFRLGVFQRPAQHRRLIVTTMVLGAAAAIAGDYLWDFMHSAAATSVPLPLQIVGGLLLLALLQELWFAFVYIGAVLLLVARSPRWLKRLRAFGVTGRMALTNYILQVIVLDLSLNSYGLGLKVRPELAPLFAATLFAVDLAFSTWWLSRYRYGPLEWIWRSVTYLKPQPLLR